MFCDALLYICTYNIKFDFYLPAIVSDISKYILNSPAKAAPVMDRVTLFLIDNY